MSEKHTLPDGIIADMIQVLFVLTYLMARSEKPC